MGGFRTSKTRLRSLGIALFLGLLLAGAFASLAHAEGTPNISATVSSSSPLYGEPVHVTLDAANPLGQPYGYNLSYRVVLPKGVSYQGGSAVPPTVIADQPATEETTLIFSNVTDLSPNSHKELGFNLTYDQSVWHAGDAIPVRAQAFINTDPRFVPKFSATGQPEGPSSTSYTGFTAEVTGEQRLKAIKVTAEEPSPEGEILRGVHEDQTVYTLKVQNNGINPTTGTELDAYVPAGLEFLGCGAPGGAGTDHTHDAIATNPGSAEEYPGSGPIKVESLAECQTPEMVETEEFDPDGPGPMPFGVYTHVRWNVGTLTAGEIKTFKYRAAVPIRANAKEFTGGIKPSGASGEQAANLDNNTGPEVVDETSLPTLAFASGTYQGTTPTPTSDETVLDRTAEDWVVHKGVEASRLEQGQNVKWTLTFETSEYKYVKEGVVTDTLPDGLCPLGPENFTSQNDPPDAECDPVAGKEPSAPYSSAIENADGTWTLTWNAAQFTPVQHTAINDKFTLTFWTHTRTHYQENFVPTTPILSRDKITNGVTTEAEGFARCVAPEATNCENPAAKISHQVTDGTKIGDASSATLEAESPTLEKFVSTGSANCATATYVRSPTVPAFHPGDKVCWKLRISFPGTLDTDAQTIADFLPPGSKYVAGSDEPHGENNVVATLDESAAASGVLTWTAENATVPAGGQIFERVIASEVAPVGTIVNGDLKGNLLKFSSANTPGESEALRAEADYEITTPVIGLVKGVEKVVRGATTVDGPNGENVDHVQVEEGDKVTYRVDVKNTGLVEAVNTEVWDRLPAEYSCSEVTGISEAGQCLTTGPGDHIVWMVPLLTTAEPGSHRKLTYTVTVPPNIGPGRTLVNTAGVAQFQSGTNTGGHFTYTPAKNINPENTIEPNAPAATDPSNVFTGGAVVGKTEKTSVTEVGNDEETQATIGETIKYTVTAEVPEGTTLGGQAELTDTLNSTERQAYVAGSAEATLNGAALPGGFELNTSGTTPKVVFPAGYNNAAGSGVDKVVLKFSVLVTNVVANVRGAELTDQANLAWTDPALGLQSINSPTLTTTIVEPLISQEKKDNKNPARVKPGEVVTYTVTTADSAATNVSAAHEVAIVDEIPIGLTPVKAAGEPLADGEEVPGSGGAVWHLASRTITKSVATIAPGAESSFSYLAQVDKEPVGGAQLTNTVKGTTASLDSTATGRRTSGSGYSATATDIVRIGGASIEKSVTPEQGTPGNPLTYHLKVTIPAGIKLFDTTVRDVLPTGVEFDGYGAETCLSGCPLANPINQYKPSVNGTTGKETIAWDLGDIPALSAPQVVEFTYSAHLRATNRVVGGNVVKGNTEINAATVSSDLTNKVGAFNENVIPTAFDETSPEAKTTTTVIEPQVTLDKKIKVGTGSFTDGPTVAHSNEPLAYQLIVKNKGNAPAYDVKVTDTPNLAVTNVQVVPQAGVTVTEPWTETTHAMALEVAGPIPAGGSTTIEYTAEFVVAGKLHDGQQVKNTAAVPKYFGVPSAERLAQPTWEFREYSGGSDSAEAILDFPTFTLAKTTGLSGNPDTGKAEVGQEFPWRIVATNTSATAGATNVKVTDTLPPNWAYTAGTAKFNGTAAPDPTITPHATGDTLEWTVPSLPAASSVTITYGAKPLLAAETTPGTAAEANVNTAQITEATDEAGNKGDETPYGTLPDTAKVTLGLPALTLEKTPDGGAATAGKPSSFTIKVKNTGNAVARNPDIEDVMAQGLGYTAGEAAGTPTPIGSETVTPDSPGTGETTIHWHLASLAENATETITVPVFVEAEVPNLTTLPNHAQVTSEEVTTPAHDEGSLLVSTEADMSIEKTGAAAYAAGENYTWHLRVKNLGPSDAQGVEVKDPLPAGTTFVSADAPCELSGGEVECALGTVPVGFDQTYDVTVHVDPNATASPLSNTATVSTTTTEPAGGGAPNSSTFGPTPSPLADVSVVKTAAPELVLFSQETEFTLEVANAGPSTARAVKVVDPLPTEGLEFISADPPCTEAGGTVTCEFGDMEPGATETVHVKAKGVKDGVWANTAAVSTTTPEPPGPAAEENDHSTAQVGVGPVADLAIVKTGPATVPAGGQLTWALEVTNNGPDAATGVNAVDTLPAGVEFLAADSGCTEAGGTVGGGIVTCAIGNLGLGESTVRHITVTVPPALGDQTLLNTAVVGGEQGDLEPENNHAEAKTTVGPSADLALTKTGPAQVNADGSITWTLVATNNGPSTATGVTVEDTMPAGVTLTSSSPSQGSCSGSLTCALGNLAEGGSAQIQVVAHIPASLARTTITNSAKIGGDQPDPDPSNNAASASTQVGDPAPTNFNLTFVKSLVGPADPQLGAVLTYALAVDNEGPATAAEVEITDTLPQALEYVSASIPGGKCSAAGPVVTCKLSSLAAGVKEKATLKARAMTAGTVKNTASVSSEHADAKQADNHDAAVAAVAAARAESAGSPVLHLVKRRLGHGAVEAGKTVAFKIRVNNTGRGAAAGVVVCDRLPGTMSFVSVAGARFKQGSACWKIAMLAPHKSRSFKVVARIAGGLGSRTVRNVATVEADNAPNRRAVAPVRVKSSGPGRGGGVTG